MSNDALSDSNTSIRSKYVAKWKEHGRKRSWPNLRYYTYHFSGKTDYNNEKPNNSSLGRDMILESPSADERRGKPVHITGARQSGKGHDYIAYVIVFLGSISICRSYKSTL